MASSIQNLWQRELLRPPPPAFVKNNIQYETMMGSVAYGVSEDTSDTDIYSFCFSKKEMLFPHLTGYIPGFGPEPESFTCWQQHHIKDPDKKKEYDITIYDIVRYFHLLSECNPNIIDSLFTPRFCVLFSTHIGNVVRENRKLFLHKGAYHRFKSYAYSQVSKINNKDKKTGKRVAVIHEFGWDTKFGAHTIRLLDECEQILLTQDIDLQQDREELKAIRRGEVSEEKFRSLMAGREKRLEESFAKSKLPEVPDLDKIKALLIQCLEHHYGSLDKAITLEDKPIKALQDIRKILDRCGI